MSTPATPFNVKQALLSLCAILASAMKLDASDKAAAEQAKAESASKDSTIAELKAQVDQLKAQVPDLSEEDHATIDAALATAVAVAPATDEQVAAATESLAAPAATE